MYESLGVFQNMIDRTGCAAKLHQWRQDQQREERVQREPQGNANRCQDEKNRSSRLMMEYLSYKNSYGVVYDGEHQQIVQRRHILDGFGIAQIRMFPETHTAVGTIAQKQNQECQCSACHSCPSLAWRARGRVRQVSA